jgi:phospholipid/cholesterol/gamma-HCH transport system substrate-binding protein
VKINNETKVGILAAFAIALLIMGYNFLKGNSIFSNEKVLYARYAQVDGLTASKPVLINGYQIGRVTNLELQPDASIKATLKINNKYDIPKNTIAKLESTDMLGNKAIVLTLGNDKEYVAEGEFLQTNIEKGLKESIEPVQKKVELIVAKMDSILGNVNNILNPNTQKNINSSFASIANTLSTLEATTKKVDGLVGSESTKLSNILTNVEAITINFKNNGKQIDGIMQNLNKVTDRVAALKFEETVNTANKTLADLQSIVGDIKSGKGSLGALINDKQMYDNLNNASKNLDALMIDLKANPGRYVHFSVFGKKDN